MRRLFSLSKLKRTGSTSPMVMGILVPLVSSCRAKALLSLSLIWLLSRST